MWPKIFSKKKVGPGTTKEDGSGKSGDDKSVTKTSETAKKMGQRKPAKVKAIDAPVLTASKTHHEKEKESKADDTSTTTGAGEKKKKKKGLRELAAEGDAMRTSGNHTGVGSPS